MTFPSPSLLSFVRESNAIEGIMREPTSDELMVHDRFLALSEVSIDDLKRFVSVIQPDAVLRDRPGLNVRVGNHVPIPGGENVVSSLETVLADANTSRLAYDNHQAYEDLHPFTDGNGRSGRVLFAWMLEKQGDKTLHQLSFLHAWYYLSLENWR